MSLGETLLMRSSRFWKLLIVEIVAVFGIAAYFLIDSHDVYRWWVGDTHFVHAPASCDLHVKSCAVNLDATHSLVFDISPKPIPLMKPLHFKVHAPTFSLSFIELKLFATNMNMGLHSFKLYPTQEGWYEGEGMLPTCVVGNMIWQANLIFNTATQSVGAIFYFQTDK